MLILEYNIPAVEFKNKTVIQNTRGVMYLIQPGVFQMKISSRSGCSMFFQQRILSFLR